MEHRQYKRIAENTDVAVLFIHGIGGTPNHFQPFLSLIPETVSVYNMLLDGHGKSVKDFSHTSMKKWEAQVQAAVEELAASHREIYIVAHSMGTLFAIEQAIKNSGIVGLFLLAVPIKLSIKPRMAVNSLKVYFNKIDSSDPVAVAAKECYGIKPDKNLFHYIGWIPRYLELFKKIRSTRKILPALKTPCSAFQSGKDEVVSVKSCAYLKENSGMSVTELKNSGHYYYEPGDRERLMEEFRKFFRYSDG